jgi:hypothetical protein
MIKLKKQGRRKETGGYEELVMRYDCIDRQY